MKVLTVSELAKNINYFLENLGEVWVEGETSNVRYSSLGHIYFTLKDEDAQIECVVFRGRRSRIQFRIEEGKKYRLRGSVEFWAKGGRLSIIVEEMLPYGIGELALKFELLKKKLDKEGLFDPAHKKPLPKYPLVIGIVTSREGAALRDMVRNLRNRFPPVRIILRPSLVQGENAAEDIAKGIE
ncbi:exodeoxyribonuclease VII large subunit, partial [bacterium]